MAVAVSMLMIGGEFDLSSGANTGAMGILVVLLVKETGDLGGAGLSLWFAIPISFLAAMGIGYFNGTMVERTALPSFIVTLGTFFVLRGMKLGFSKLIVDQIQVGRTDEGHGYDFWRPIFAGEWDRTLHQWGARDTVYTVAVLLGLALILLAVYEMHFTERQRRPQALRRDPVPRRRRSHHRGVVVLHVTDGTGGNWLGAAVIAVGAIVGSARVRDLAFRADHRSRVAEPHPDVSKWLGLGLGSLVVGTFIAWQMNSSYLNAENIEEGLFFPFTKQGFRATAFLALVSGGFTMLMIAGHHAKRVSVVTKTAVSMLTAC